MNKKKKIIVITAIWHFFYGVNAFVNGIRCFFESNGEHWWIITRLGIVPTLTALYLLWGRYKIPKYLFLSYCIVNSIVWGVMILAPNSFSFWGGLFYTLYFVLGIVFSIISLSIIRHS